MKKIFALFSSLLLFSFFIFSCSSESKENPLISEDIENPDDNNNNSDNESGSNDSQSSANQSVTLLNGFIRGFDASSVDFWENDYAPSNSWADKSWYDTDSSKKDFFQILKEHGVNTVRLRVWVDPSETSTSSIVTGDSTWPASPGIENAWRNGDCSPQRMTSLAKRVKDAGLYLLLDFHLSDYWTDPAVQLIPSFWQSASDSTQMCSYIKEHITSVLNLMKQNDVKPDYVQVGNEIDKGLLTGTSVTVSSVGKTETEASSAIAGPYTSENFKLYLKAGSSAVREFDSSIKIIIHMTNQNIMYNFPYVDKSGADYDIIGISYYPWENHGTVADLKNNIATLKSTYGKHVLVTETSAFWNESSDTSALQKAASNLIDPLTSSVYSDLTLSEDSTYVKGSIENQKAILTHLMNEAFDAGAAGLCTWGGERREDYAYALFSWQGKAFDSMDVYKIEFESSVEEPPVIAKINFPHSENVTGTGSNITFLKASDFASLSDGDTVSVKVKWLSQTEEAESGSIAAGCGTSWPSLTWVDSTGSVTFTSADLKEAGLTLWIPSGVTYQITVSVE